MNRKQKNKIKTSAALSTNYTNYRELRELERKIIRENSCNSWTNEQPKSRRRAGLSGAEGVKQRETKKENQT
jgi:hypothetical protein